MEIKFENEREFLIGMAEMFISSRQMDKAIDAVELLSKKFPVDGKLLLLQARIFDLYGDFEHVIRNGEAALARRDTSTKDTMMLHNIVANAYDNVGMIDRAAAHYLASSRVDRRAEFIAEAREDYSNYLFALHRLSSITSEKIFAAVKDYDKLFGGVKRFKRKRVRHEKIRVGYISPDLRAHVAGYFAAAFFTHHDRERFEVIGCAACKEDQFSEFLKSNAEGWRNIRGDDASTAARKIFDDDLDILVDLSGHTAHNCLPVLAYKPAPIQISGVGWIDSTGLRAVDYFFVDRYTVPDKRGEKFFTERVIRLPHSHFCYRQPDDDLELKNAPCLENDFITFGAFNNFSKVTDEQLRLWSRIMLEIPTARLLIKSTVFNSEAGRNYAIARLRAAKIDLDRVRLERGDQYADYMKKFRAIDILLDTFPYVGGGTTCDALYMGVPVVTRVGDRHGSRFGLSFLSNVGAEELCAFDDEEYVAKAVELANDFPRVEKYHQTLRQSMKNSSLMNAAAYMSDIENAYVEILR